MKDKEKQNINFGVQECSKCQYKIRCEECVYNEKDIGELIKFEKKIERKETAEKILNELYCTPKERVESKIKELARFIGVEIKE
jgi:hypothetical protein